MVKITISVQLVANKALGVSTVYVEAVDPDGNRVVDRVESEVGTINTR